jgi:hypothetical protein
MIGCVETNPGMEAASSSSASAEDGTWLDVTLRQFNILEFLKKQRSEETAVEAFSAIDLQESEQVITQFPSWRVFWVSSLCIRSKDT